MRTKSHKIKILNVVYILLVIGFLATVIGCIAATVSNTNKYKYAEGEYTDMFTIVFNGRTYHQSRHCPDNWALDFNSFEDAEEKIKINDEYGYNILNKAPNDPNDYLIYTRDFFGDVLFFAEDIVYPSFSQAESVEITYIDETTGESAKYLATDKEIIAKLTAAYEKNGNFDGCTVDGIDLSSTQIERIFMYFPDFPMHYCKIYYYPSDTVGDT